MASLNITFQPEDRTVKAQTGERLLDVAAREGIDITNLCGGQGVCGKCRVKILEGRPRQTSKTIGFLDKSELDEGTALACQTEVLQDDLVVWVPPQARSDEEQILTADNILTFGPPAPVENGRAAAIPYFHPLCKKHYLELPRPSLTDNLSDLDRILRELRKKVGELQFSVDFGCLKGLAKLLRQSDWKVTVTLHLRDLDCPQIRMIEGGNTTRRSYGVAVDVGTTTIVAQLVDIKTGNVIAAQGSHNLQARYGEDVISRMIFACGRGGMAPLAEAVTSTINSLIDSLVNSADIAHEDISCIVTAGNTTMSHLLLGLEPCAIRVEPYIPTANRFPPTAAREVGLRAHPRALLHCMPCVSSYVGGDITAGVLACGMNDRQELSALIDVGTNGEIVVGNSEWLVCCSASAGPAFEGGGTKCGMRATKGAIEKVRIDGRAVFYGVIGGAKPRGICGSALIDLMAELLMARIIDQSGKFIDLDHPRVTLEDGTAEFVVAPAAETETGHPVVMTEDDMGNLIKSKGAILAAMKVLLDNLGMTFANLERIYVAGGFGAHLDIDKAITIGLLPDIARERIQFIGNSSLAGSRFALLSTHAFSKVEAIAKQMTYFELSVHPEFMNEFVASLFLPHTQMELFPSVKQSLELANRRPPLP